MQVKKLMTIVKSKYFMLKANFPKHALKVDSEPLIDTHSVPRAFTFGGGSDPAEGGEATKEDQIIRKQSMVDDPKHALLPNDEESTESDRQAQYKKDREAFE